MISSLNGPLSFYREVLRVHVFFLDSTKISSDQSHFCFSDISKVFLSSALWKQSSPLSSLSLMCWIELVVVFGWRMLWVGPSRSWSQISVCLSVCLCCSFSNKQWHCEPSVSGLTSLFPVAQISSCSVGVKQSVVTAMGWGSSGCLLVCWTRLNCDRCGLKLWLAWRFHWITWKEVKYSVQLGIWRQMVNIFTLSSGMWCVHTRVFF